MLTIETKFGRVYVNGAPLSPSEAREAARQRLIEAQQLVTAAETAERHTAEVFDSSLNQLILRYLNAPQHSADRDAREVEAL